MNGPSALRRGLLIDGRYLLEESLPPQGLGETWRAEDKYYPGRKARVKFLTLPPGVAAQRFVRRAKSLGALRHPNVVAVTNQGVFQSRPFLVLEGAPGETLREWLDAFSRAGRLPALADVGAVFEPMCAGVQAAHGDGLVSAIVHGALSASSVLVQRKATGNGFDVGVCDFAIAEFDAGASERRAEYAAPEQSAGGEEAPTVDVFALAVILVEMLTGRAVHGRPFAQLAHEGSVLPLLESLRADVPPAIWNHLAIALREDPAQRPMNAAALLDPLRSAWPRYATAPVVTAPVAAPVTAPVAPAIAPVVRAPAPQPTPAAPRAPALAPAVTRPVTARTAPAPAAPPMLPVDTAPSAPVASSRALPAAPSTDSVAEPTQVTGRPDILGPRAFGGDTAALPIPTLPSPLDDDDDAFDAPPTMVAASSFGDDGAPAHNPFSPATSDPRAGPVLPPQLASQFGTVPPGRIVAARAPAPAPTSPTGSPAPDSFGLRAQIQRVTRTVAALPDRLKIAIITGVALSSIAAGIAGAAWLAMSMSSDTQPPAPPSSTGPSSPNDPSGSASTLFHGNGAPAPHARCPQGTAHVDGAMFGMFEPAADSPDEMTATHRMHVDEMCVDRTEVTTGQYRACVDAGRCAGEANTPQSTAYPAAALRALARFCTLADPTRTRAPVTCVDWSQAVAYCTFRGGRLPTEAEWEYVARGGDDRRYPWGREVPAPELVNGCGAECRSLPAVLGVHGALYHASDPWIGAADVGSIPGGASPFDVLDMAGNVWEWTADTVPGPTGVPSEALRVVRGGGFLDTQPTALRVTSRQVYRAETRLPQVGFRCVRAVEPAPRVRTP